jgi:hypothetical protein
MRQFIDERRTAHNSKSLIATSSTYPYQPQPICAINTNIASERYEELHR